MAMTVPMMTLLKKLLSMTNWPLEKKRLYWAVSSIAFHGSFRVHELLSRQEESFDPSSTLLGKDVRLAKVRVEGREEEVLIIHLKAPKEDRLSSGINIELFATGTSLCPVKAWKKWMEVRKERLQATKPVFRQSSGKCMSGSLFNRDLKNLLGKYIDYSKGKITTHSFRSGFASFMAEAGYKDEEIMRQGRWHSEAFKVYCKTGRGSRMREQRDLARKIASMMK